MSGIIIKNKHTIEKMRIGGKLLAQIMHEMHGEVVEGVSTFHLDALIESKMRQVGLKPVCK